MYFRHFRLVALLLLTVAASADAAVLPGSLSYDGTYTPNSVSPPSGQTQWSYFLGPNNSLTPNSPAGMATLIDNGTAAGERISFFKPLTSAPFTSFAANPTNFEWESAFRMQLNALGGPTANNNLLFGMRDEGGNGKAVLLGIDGGGGNPATVGGLRLYTTAATSVALLNNYNFNDGLMHEYRVRKYLDPVDSQMKVRILVDGYQIGGPILASSLPDDTSNTNGFGYFSPSSGTSTVRIDQVSLGTLGPTPELIEPRYDGSYQPGTFNPAAGQTTFNVVNTIAPANMTTSGGILQLNDNSAAGRLSMFNPWPRDIQNESWVYEARLKIDAISGAPILLGVRDENGQGRTVMLGWSQNSGALSFYTGGVTPFLSLSNDNFIDGLFHTYRVVKLWDGANFWVHVYIDGAALAPIAYNLLPLDLNADNGFGYFGSTPGLSNVSLDYMNFAIVPEPSTSALIGFALVLAPIGRRRLKRRRSAFSV